MNYSFGIINYLLKMLVEC